MSSSIKKTAKPEPVNYLQTAFFFIVFGCIFFITGKICDTPYEELKKSCTFSTTATVTELIESPKNNSKVAPVFEFEFQNRNCKYTGDVYKKKGTYEIGDTVKIYIDPLLPSRFYIPGYTKGEKWSEISKFIINAIAVLTCGIGVFIFIGGLFGKNGDDKTNHLDDVSDDCIDEVSTYEDTDEYQ